MQEFYKNPFIRSAIFIPLFIYAASNSWASLAGDEFKPIYCVIPFSKFVYENYILFKPKEEQTYPEGVMQSFIEEKELRMLAVPPSKGGPLKQIVYVIEGYAISLTLLFVAIPFTPLQLIGLMISMSSNLGFIFNMILYENVELAAIPFGVFLDISITILGLVTVVY